MGIGSMMGMERPFVLGPGTLSRAAGAAPRPCGGRNVDLGLTDKVALVTGSYRGTGAGIARSLAGEGAVVLVHGLEPGQADEVVSDIAAGGGRAHVVVGDIRSEDGSAVMVDAVRAQVDRVDI